MYDYTVKNEPWSQRRLQPLNFQCLLIDFVFVHSTLYGKSNRKKGNKNFKLIFRPTMHVDFTWLRNVRIDSLGAILFSKN